MLKKGKVIITAVALLAIVFSFAGMAQAKRGSQLVGVVNVNSATAEELAMVPGIGPSKAQSIISFRETEKFSSVEDLTKVKGIGDKMLAKIQAYVTVDGPTTAKVIKNNTLSLDTSAEGEQG